MEQCKYCKSTKLSMVPKPPHVGLYCDDCGRFQRWVKQNKDNGEIASADQQRYALSLLSRWKKNGEPMTKAQAGAIIQAFK